MLTQNGEHYQYIVVLGVHYESFMNGGEKGIRTLDTIARIHAFQACAFNRSATSPKSKIV